MASIVKRRKKFSVVYSYIDEHGNKRQKWETFDSNAEAKKRKAQIEFEQESGTFIVPTAKTVADLLSEYMNVYGVNTWAISTYEGNRSLIDNYILPIIGDKKLDDLNPRVMDQYYRSLQSVKPVYRNNKKPNTEYLTAQTIRSIHKLLRNAFNQAVKWELMSKNPVEHATLPKVDQKHRDIWTSDVLFKAIELCDDDILCLAMNLSFSCSLRMGEMLGLTWDCIDISENSINNKKASVYVNKELQRCNRDVLEKLDEKDVLFKFPSAIASTHTRLVLKKPKTKTSVRRIYLPQTVAEMLIERKSSIENMKELFGDEYTDYDLVFCSSNGRPIEGNTISKNFARLIEENDLPRVVFHSLRHSSITYKLKLNGGDIKSVQGDSGHAQVKMVTDIYSHILDEDRVLNAQRFEDTFYHPKEDDKSTLTSISSPSSTNEIKGAITGTGSKTDEAAPSSSLESEKAGASASDEELLLKLLKNPEMSALLKALAKNI